MRHLLTDLRGNPISFASRRRQRRYRHPNLPALFYLVQNRSWEGVVRRARTHAHEIVIQEDGSGNTPLHIACRLDPPSEAVRALLRASQILNAEGATALHVAATHRCSAKVIEALLEPTESPAAGKSCKHVSSTAILTKRGRAPIHYACMSFRGLGVDAFRVLLEATIQTGYVTIEDNVDDDFKADDEDEDVESTSPMDRVVNVMTMQDCTGETPLGLLFRRYRERVRYVIKAVENLRKEEHEGSSAAASLAAAITVHADLGELWEKARLIVGKLTEDRLQREGDKMIDFFNLEAASPAEAAVAQEAAAWAAERHRHSMRKEQPSQFTTGRSREFRVVHASVGLTGYGCPPEMILLAISMHPNQVREMDEDGNLPLHIAAVASSYLTTRNNSTNQTGHFTGSDEDSIVSELSFLSNITTCSEACFDKVIKILLKHYPAAARIPNGESGRLPLILAIDAGRRTWDDGIKSLLDAYPPALESRRICMPLYPSILALLGRPKSTNITKSKAPSWRTRFASSGRKHNTSLTTLFELVKAKPDLVQEALEASR